MEKKENVAEYAAEKVSYKDILKQKEYLKIMLASLINRFGDSIDAIAFTWLYMRLPEARHGRRLSLQ